MPRKPDLSRLPIAIKLIEKNGMAMSKALRRAGYSESTSKNPTQNPTIAKALRRAQDNFAARFMNSAEQIGLTPEFSTKQIFDVAKNGKNVEKIMAINAYHKVILHDSELEARRQKYSGTIHVTQNNFIVPPPISESEWKAKAIAAETVLPEPARVRETVNRRTRARTQKQK